MVDTVVVENEQIPASVVSWPAILAGAVVTGAASLILLAVGSGLGFSVMNPWSHTAGMNGAETTKAATVAGIYLTATAVLASAVGGYVTGRLRTLWHGTHPHEAYFRDTAHGLITWGVATLVGAAVIGSAGAAITGGASREAARYAVNDGGGAFTDRLFDYDAATVAKAQGGQDTASMTRGYNGDRAAASRALATASMPGHVMTADERQRLAVMVSARTGMALPDADKRVAAVEADARNAAETARRVAMMLSFWLAASMLAGALASCLAAWEGGAVRDGRLVYGRR